MGNFQIEFTYPEAKEHSLANPLTLQLPNPNIALSLDAFGEPTKGNLKRSFIKHLLRKKNRDIEQIQAKTGTVLGC